MDFAPGLGDAVPDRLPGDTTAPGDCVGVAGSAEYSAVCVVTENSLVWRNATARMRAAVCDSCAALRDSSSMLVR